MPETVEALARLGMCVAFVFGLAVLCATVDWAAAKRGWKRRDR